VFGGCHLTRSIADLVTDAGVTITDVDVLYDKGAPEALAADLPRHRGRPRGTARLVVVPHFLDGL
jgi:hypothetical protein